MKVFVFIFFLVISSFSEEPEWNWKWDGPVLLTGIGFQLWGNYHLNQLDQSIYDKDELLPWDQPLVGTKSEFYGSMSNWLSIPGLLVPLGANAFANSKWTYLQNDLYFLSEILTINSALNLWIRSIGFWSRPEYYHPDNTQTTGQVRGSFYSGHSSAAFAVASYFSWRIYDRPEFSKTKWYWIGGMYSTAAAVAIARVAAGKHYWSDIIVGAVVGTFLSWAITELHQKEQKLEQGNIAVLAQGSGISIRIPF